MPENKKVTKRERREEAKQRRMEELRRRQRKARMRRLYTIGIVVLAIGGIVAAVLLSRQGASKNAAELRRIASAGGCQAIETKPEEGNQHSAPFTYRTDPPTSGNHSGSTAFTGVLLTQVAKDENLVHNMEHGHVIIWYQPDLDPAILTGLTDMVNDDRTRLILVQRPGMPFKVAFTAWTKLQGCNSPNANTVKAADAFVKEFKGQGPEGDRPGTPAGA
jgi:hypothetical protein